MTESETDYATGEEEGNIDDDEENAPVPGPDDSCKKRKPDRRDEDEPDTDKTPRRVLIERNNPTVLTCR